MNPKISFVMPTKNREGIIRQAIQSIIAQDMPEWELVIVDDHSNPEDKTRDIVLSLADDRIKYIRIPDNFAGGIPCARNFGNIFARSQIIAVADSDDISLPHRARVTIESFENNNCDVFYAGYEVFNKTNNEMKEIKHPVVDFDLELLKQRNFIPHGSSAYKRVIAYQFPYNSFFRVAEDYDFFSRLAEAEKNFYFCNQKVYQYVLHQDNITSGKKCDDYDNLIKAIRGWSDNSAEISLDKIANSNNT